MTLGSLRVPRVMLAFAIQTAQPKNDPIIVRIIDPPNDVSGLADVLLGALGLTGVIVLAALVCGVLFAGVMFFVRSRQSSDGS